MEIKVWAIKAPTIDRRSSIMAIRTECRQGLPSLPGSAHPRSRSITAEAFMPLYYALLQHISLALEVDNNGVHTLFTPFSSPIQLWGIANLTTARRLYQRLD